jgi:hypothetical protein
VQPSLRKLRRLRGSNGFILGCLRNNAAASCVNEHLHHSPLRPHASGGLVRPCIPVVMAYMAIREQSSRLCRRLRYSGVVQLEIEIGVPGVPAPGEGYLSLEALGQLHGLRGLKIIYMKDAYDLVSASRHCASSWSLIGLKDWCTQGLLGLYL